MCADIQNRLYNIAIFAVTHEILTKVQPALPNRKILTLFIFLIALSPLRAQIYESVFRPKLDWYELRSPHFRVIYHEGEDSAARTTAQLLESQYEIVQSLVGGKVRRLPVVLNGYNDNANGFVTPLHFRIEMEVPSIRGKAMNPRTGGWLENVVPHELVHALHISVVPTLGVGGLIRPFSPDLSRMVHMAAPFGLFEGIAVFHETNMIYREGGRGNYPYFTRNFSSRVQGNPWRLSQMHQSPVATRPFNRIYSGGYEFTSWLLYEHGFETTKNTIRFISRFPFLGYGVALWSVTGDSPSALYRDFMDDKLDEEAFRLQPIERAGATAYRVLQTGRKGDEVRRPLWISNDEILFYGSFYNDRPGFRRYNLQTGRMTMLLESRTMGDYGYALSPDRSRLIYSRYHSHPWHHNTYISDLHEFDLNTGGLNRKTDGARLFAPEYGPAGVINALKTDHESSAWVRIHPGGREELVLRVHPDNLVAIAVRPRAGDHNRSGPGSNSAEYAGHARGTDSDFDPVQFALTHSAGSAVKTWKPAHTGYFSPAGNDQSVQYAVVANRNGVQGLWLLRDGEEAEILRRAPDIAFRDAVVFDPQWSPDGSRLLLSSDYGGVMNLYEYEPERDRMVQVTNSRYNAFEGSYSPDGNRVAFVTLEEGYHRGAVMERSEFMGTELSDVIWRSPAVNRMRAGRLGSHLDEQAREWEVKPYRDYFSFLRPRMVVPLLTYEQGPVGYRPGVMLAGGDVLRRSDYTLELTTSNNQLWYDVTYRNRSFFPGISVSGFREPSAFGVMSDNGRQEFIFDETGLRAGIPLTFTIDTYARSSWFQVNPSVRYGTLQAIDNRGNPISDRTENARYSLFAAYYHRLQQNIRDHQPNTGYILFASTDHEFHTTADMLRRGVRGGVIGFFSPWMTVNHSIRVAVEGVYQSSRPIYSLSGLSREFDGNILTGFRNAGNLRFRYTIPLATVDRGSLTVPLFLHRAYLVLFTNTATDLDRAFDLENTRTIYGAGLRFRFDLFNLPVDLGVAFGYEPTRGSGYGWVGDF
ncbi:MAG: hypothetical protein EA364_01105 [Balneolaceae bacterium]|nr:MAG: hypothetical protein EA364_01105 [Balneolaceae bacterium]